MKLDKQKEAIFYQAIGYNIRLARKQLRLTQKDLAFLTGLSRVSINNIENGKQRLPAHWISPICKLLGKNINDVIPIFEGEVKTLSELMESKLAKVQGKLLDTHFAGKPVQEQ
jgi:transcriptional regulator with XRE-family HTH domain